MTCASPTANNNTESENQTSKKHKQTATGDDSRQQRQNGARTNRQ
jgi:hypothetical protein